MLLDAKLENDWNHTAVLCALIANIVRDPNKPARNIEEFHPCIRNRPHGTSADTDRGNVIQRQMENMQGLPGETQLRILRKLFDKWDSQADKGEDESRLN